MLSMKKTIWQQQHIILVRFVLQTANWQL